ncbi:hypothetical protein PG985_014910 [Apiospora marii]|uniref:Uncharacterized protein n=1 Tax=Apiospora marii TaxID=335849 RepID=A0ABR1RJ61_9PEZI
MSSVEALLNTYVPLQPFALAGLRGHLVAQIPGNSSANTRPPSSRRAPHSTETELGGMDFMGFLRWRSFAYSWTLLGSPNAASAFW